ncbi:zinc-ribbon domain-containing protein [Microbacterium hydrocarbonoxydans]|uniref:zinc-ribbon domain-containing protein n=1 Tax=Microbacterium hydrocarbonoxydans TaxID=273678 RepID=UPI00203A5653|nr:zinc-ribbon domain-containing protein [Microbacterium hydrocarbonoxydans]MCM3778805.1 zinc-ribbon domain-containing protein [Microbacterium hydrocarbonoxydans]
MQEVVGKDVVNADRRYQALRRQGLLDAHRLAELLDCVDEWAATESGGTATAPERFRIAVELAHQVMRPGRLAVMMSVGLTAELRYNALTSVVGGILHGRESTVLTDALWLMLRALGHAAETGVHAFVVPAAYAVGNDEAHLEQLKSCTYPRARHLHLVQYVCSEFPGTRFSRLHFSASANTYLCARGHRFQSSGLGIKRSARTAGCGVCSNRTALAGYNSLVDTHPEVAAEWHPTANGDLTPERIIAGSDRTHYWLCENGHTFTATVTARTSNKNGCGVCSNRVVQADVNSLAAMRPDLAAEWHGTLNDGLTPEQVSVGTDRKVWWRCPEGHDYPMAVSNRSRKKRASSCSVCSGQRADPSTCLATTHKAVARRWHNTRNGNLRPTDVIAGSTKRVWWQCARGHEYQAVVYSQTKADGHGCNVCLNRAVNADNCMRATHGALADQFHESLNGDKTPDNVIASTKVKFWWRCKLGHEWQAAGSNRVKGTGCPFCSGLRVLAGWNDMATTHPQLVDEWHESRNPGLRPENVRAGTPKQLWWRCAEGHEWQARGADRRRGSGCPYCTHQKVLVGFNDLATTNPALGAELHPNLNADVTATSITARSSKRLWWRCSAGHEWTAPAYSRARTGSMCPECRRELRRGNKR